MPDLVLEWCRDQIRAVSATAGSQPVVRSAVTWTNEDHHDAQVPVAQVGGDLKAWLKREGISVSQAIVILPREAVILRRLQLPVAPADELPDLVRFQAATRTSSPIESLALDYLPLQTSLPDSGQEVVTFTIDRDRLARIIGICTAAGLNVEQVSVSSLSVANLIRANESSDLRQSGPELHVYQAGTRVELSVLDHGTLVFSHATQLFNAESNDRIKPLTTELSRCLLALGQAQPNSNVQRCFYLSGHEDAQVVEFLQQRFPQGLRKIDGSQLTRGDSANGYESLIGAFIPERDQNLRIDLLHPRQKRDVPDRRRLYAGIGAGVLGLGILFAFYSFYSQKGTLEQSILQLQDEVNSQQKQLQQGKQRAQAHARVAHWNEASSNPIDLWNQLRERLPDTNRVYFVELRIVPTQGETLARFLGRGQARTRNDIEGLSQSLSDYGFRVRPTTPTLGKRDADYPWQFELDVELIRPVPAPQSTNLKTLIPVQKS